MQKAQTVAAVTHLRKAGGLAHGKCSNTDHKKTLRLQLTSYVGGKKSDHSKTSTRGILKFKSILCWNLANTLYYKKILINVYYSEKNIPAVIFTEILLLFPVYYHMVHC